MRIQNTTTFTAAELREVIRFVKPSDVSNFDIHFKNCGGPAYHCVNRQG